MEKIINGSRYNTSKARTIGTWKNDRFSNDFIAFLETLHKSKTGKYFIHEEVIDTDGGLASGYAVIFGDESKAAERIRPLTVEEARQWAEEKLSSDNYVEEFGEIDESSDERKVISCSVPLYQYEKLARLRTETKKTISSLIEEAIFQTYKF